MWRRQCRLTITLLRHPAGEAEVKFHTHTVKYYALLSVHLIEAVQFSFQSFPPGSLNLVCVTNVLSYMDAFLTTRFVTGNQDDEKGL